MKFWHRWIPNWDWDRCALEWFRNNLRATVWSSFFTRSVKGNFQNRSTSMTANLFDKNHKISTARRPANSIFQQMHTLIQLTVICGRNFLLKAFERHWKQKNELFDRTVPVTIKFFLTFSISRKSLLSLIQQVGIIWCDWNLLVNQFQATEDEQWKFLSDREPFRCSYQQGIT